MPKVVVYVPAADARWLEDRHGDVAEWVRSRLKRAVEFEKSRAAALEGDDPVPPDAGIREPRRPLPSTDTGTATLEPPEPTEQQADAVARPLPDREFKPDFKKEKKR